MASHDTERNKQVIRDVYTICFNGRQYDRLGDYYREDFRVHDPGHPTPIQSLPDLRQLADGLTDAFPDHVYVLEDLIAEGDRVAVRWSAHGTHRGKFGDIPARGNRFWIQGLAIARFHDGKIAEVWQSFDNLGLAQQCAATQSSPK